MISSQRNRSAGNKSEALKDALLKLIPSLRAYALSLCADRGQADDLVQVVGALE